eukprot:CAMPEP_0201921660 /NCGR_PEP_ID=MMETSP0903-20130614/9922_1 /ASSEMBLY_ACC=CAM_ASM_000552 /TAXON_ID=420261 /ORGANISM="Thalassiosira antarctica, Strain CCMP982" /LENGTH=531 /DNA_ID=CAMNT_0048458657 /DNA_START=121 /DNA_END=1716 /DNA_ORIENTATION=+
MAKARKNAASATPLPPSSPNNNMNIGEYDEDCNDKRGRGQLKWKFTHFMTAVQYILRIITSTAFSTTAMAFILASLFITDEELQSTSMKIGMGYLCVAKPLLSTLHICCDIDLGEKDGKGGRTMTRIIAFSFLLSIICNQFPKWLSAFVACCAVFAFGLASRQLVSQQSQSTVIHSQLEHTTHNDDSNVFQRTWSRLSLKERAALGGIAVVASLLIENFIIWVVSATYQPGIDGSPESLQDNGRIVLEKLVTKIFNVNAPRMAANALQKLRDSLNVQWSLVSSFGASLVCLELQLGKKSQRTLPGLAFHAVMTLALARVIRTISFFLTVLPSQVPNCYARHFPPPPEEWTEWLMIGFLPNSRGGCNDLILSGHATITSTLGCAFTSAASNTSFSIAVWTLIALDYSIEVYQGLHYSVDMWLGCIVTCLLWQLTKPLEIGGDREQQNQNQNGNTTKGSTVRPPPLNATIVGIYALPAILAFVVLTVVPEAYVNYFLLGFSLWVGVIFARFGFTNFLQHVLLCELCFGLGAYL